MIGFRPPKAIGVTPGIETYACRIPGAARVYPKTEYMEKRFDSFS